MLTSNESNIDRIEKLYHKYKNLLYKEAFNILNDALLAEDALQQTFIKIIDNFEKIKMVKENKITYYLVMVCRNVSYDMQKSRMALNKNKDIFDYENEDEEGELIDFAEPVEVVINKETVSKVAKAIGELPDKYKDVLLLEKIYGYKKEEIAKLLNINYETVKKRSQRARDILAKVLEKEES